MSYTSEHFRTRVRELEALAKRSPRRFRLQATLTTVIGYLWILAMSLGFIFISFLMGFLAWLIEHDKARGLFVGATFLSGSAGIAFLSIFIKTISWRIPGTEGLRLFHESAPALFEVIEEARVAQRAPKLAGIYISQDANAGVSFNYRFGLIGFARYYLTIGLPLLEGLSVTQFRSVLAHEFAHLTHNHPTSGMWVWRIWRYWCNVDESIKRTKWGPLISNFIDWYLERLFAYASVMWRVREYEADREQARITGRENLALSLLRSDRLSYHFDNAFWPKVFRRATTDPLPPDEIHALMAEAASTPFAEEEDNDWLRALYAEKTRANSSHPATLDRLRVVGYPVPPNFSEGRALLDALGNLPPEDVAATLLGRSRQAVHDAVSMNWRTNIIGEWRRVHTVRQEDLRKYDELAKREKLDEEEEWDLVRIKAEYIEYENKEALYRDFLRQHPAQPEASWRLGCLLYRKNDPECLLHLDAASKMTARATEALNLIFSFHDGRDDKDEILRAEKRLKEWDGLCRKADEERFRLLDPKDELLPPTLEQEEMEYIKGLLVARAPHVKKAWFVRKKVTLLSDLPCHILIVDSPGLAHDRVIPEMQKVIKATEGRYPVFLLRDVLTKTIEGKVLAVGIPVVADLKKQKRK